MCNLIKKHLLKNVTYAKVNMSNILLFSASFEFLYAINLPITFCCNFAIACTRFYDTLDGSQILDYFVILIGLKGIWDKAFQILPILRGCSVDIASGITSGPFKL